MDNRDKILKAIEDHLDTRDKRFMFLKCNFPEVIPFINLEGNGRNTSFNIYEEFNKRNMLGSLISTMNAVFELNLSLN